MYSGRLAAGFRVVKRTVTLTRTMVDRPAVTPDYFEILVVRELRKTGLEVTDPRVHRRTELPDPEQGFLMELIVLLRRNTWQKRALIACRRQVGAVGVDAIDDLARRLVDAKADVGLVFATAEFTPSALAAGHDRGIALLRVVDARSAFDAGGWGAAGHYPSWLPAHLVQLVDLDSAGQARARLLEAGHANIIVEQIGAEGGVS
jgi:hypothetical protein